MEGTATIKTGWPRRLVCAFRLAPGFYPTDDFDQLFPPPEEDKAYKCLLEFGGEEPYASLGGKQVQRFH
jgi:hypothetical protein